MKKVILGILAAIMLLTATACNCAGYDFIDTNHFDRAIIKMPGGEVIEVDVKTWADLGGERLTITATDGTRYLVSNINCILIEDN